MKHIQNQSGMALIITLLLLLSLLMMASAITYITMSFANLADSVTHKPLAIDASESCIDKGFEWLSNTSSYPTGGSDWVNGPGIATDIASNSSMPLFGYNIITDTIPFGMGDSRASPLLNIAGRTRCNSVIIEKLASLDVGTGSEVGTSDYSKNKSIIVKITASGLFDVPLKTDGVTIDSTLWRSSSSQAKLEVIAGFNP
jgi:hypothetical protein